MKEESLYLENDVIKNPKIIMDSDIYDTIKTADVNIIKNPKIIISEEKESSTIKEIPKMIAGTVGAIIQGVGKVGEEFSKGTISSPIFTAVKETGRKLEEGMIKEKWMRPSNVLEASTPYVGRMVAYLTGDVVAHNKYDKQLSDMFGIKSDLVPSEQIDYSNPETAKRYEEYDKVKKSMDSGIISTALASLPPMSIQTKEPTIIENMIQFRRELLKTKKLAVGIGDTSNIDTPYIDTFKQIADYTLSYPEVVLGTFGGMSAGMTGETMRVLGRKFGNKTIQEVGEQLILRGQYFQSLLNPDDPDMAQKLTSAVTSLGTFYVMGRVIANPIMKAKMIPQFFKGMSVAGGMALMESAQVSGEVWSNVYRKTGDETKAHNAARNAMLSTIAILGITDKIFLTQAMKPGITSKLVAGFPELVQETTQTDTSYLAAGELPPVSESIESGILGYFSAVIGGAGIAKYERRIQRKEAATKLKETLDKQAVTAELEAIEEDAVRSDTLKGVKMQKKVDSIEDAIDILKKKNKKGVNVLNIQTQLDNGELKYETEYNINDLKKIGFTMSTLSLFQKEGWIQLNENKKYVFVEETIAESVTKLNKIKEKKGKTSADIHAELKQKHEEIKANEDLKKHKKAVIQEQLEKQPIVEDTTENIPENAIPEDTIHEDIKLIDPTQIENELTKAEDNIENANIVKEEIKQILGKTEKVETKAKTIPIEADAQSYRKDPYSFEEALITLDKEVVERRDDIIRWSKNQAQADGWIDRWTPEIAIDEHYGKYVRGLGSASGKPLKKGETWRGRLVKMVTREQKRVEVKTKTEPEKPKISLPKTKTTKQKVEVKPKIEELVAKKKVIEKDDNIKIDDAIALQELYVNNTRDKKEKAEETLQLEKLKAMKDRGEKIVNADFFNIKEPQKKIDIIKKKKPKITKKQKIETDKEYWKVPEKKVEKVAVIEENIPKEPIIPEKFNEGDRVYIITNNKRRGTIEKPVVVNKEEFYRVKWDDIRMGSSNVSKRVLGLIPSKMGSSHDTVLLTVEKEAKDEQEVDKGEIIDFAKSIVIHIQRMLGDVKLTHKPSEEIAKGISIPALEKALTLHGKKLDDKFVIEGTYYSMNMSGKQLKHFITVASEFIHDPTKVTDITLHEAYHGIREMLRQTPEGQKWISLLTSQYANEELEANAFRDYIKGKIKTPIKSEISNIFRQIRNFFESLANYLRGRGFRRASKSIDLFERAWKGDVIDSLMSHIRNNPFTADPFVLSPPLLTVKPYSQLQTVVSKDILNSKRMGLKIEEAMTDNERANAYALRNFLETIGRQKKPMPVNRNAIDHVADNLWIDLRGKVLAGYGKEGFFNTSINIDRMLTDEFIQQSQKPQYYLNIKKNELAKEQFQLAMLDKLNQRRQEIHQQWVDILDKIDSSATKYTILSNILKRRYVIKNGKPTLILFDPSSNFLPILPNQQLARDLVKALESQDVNDLAVITYEFLKKQYGDENIVSKGKDGDWLLVEGKEKAVQLSTLAQNTECCIADTGTASNYLEINNFLVYKGHDGEGKVFIPHSNDTISEISGNLPLQSVDPQYEEEISNILKKQELDYDDNYRKIPMELYNIEKSLKEGTYKGDLIDDIFRLTYYIRVKEGWGSFKERLPAYPYLHMSYLNIKRTQEFKDRQPFDSYVVVDKPINIPKYSFLEELIVPIDGQPVINVLGGATIKNLVVDNDNLIINNGNYLNILDIEYQQNTTKINPTIPHGKARIEIYPPKVGDEVKEGRIFDGSGITKVESLFINSNAIFPDLQKVEWLNIKKEKINAPLLKNVKQLTIDNSQIEANELEAVEELRITNAIAHLPALKNTDKIKLNKSRLTANQLKQSSRIHLIDNSQIEANELEAVDNITLSHKTELIANQLKHIKNLTMDKSAIEANNLETIKDTAYIRLSTVELPTLKKVKKINIENSAVTINNLESIDTLFLSNWHDDRNFNGILNAESLKHIGYFSINSITTLNAPSLKSIDALEGVQALPTEVREKLESLLIPQISDIKLQIADDAEKVRKNVKKAKQEYDRALIRVGIYVYSQGHKTLDDWIKKMKKIAPIKKKQLEYAFKAVQNLHRGVQLSMQAEKKYGAIDEIGYAATRAGHPKTPLSKGLTNMLDLIKKPISISILDTTIFAFEKIDHTFGTNFTDIIRRPLEIASKNARLKVLARANAAHTIIKKHNLSLENFKNIMSHAILQQEGGKEALNKTKQRQIKDLSPQEQELYYYMMEAFQQDFIEFNEARQIAGKPPITGIDNYFTWQRLVSDIANDNKDPVTLSLNDIKNRLQYIKGFQTPMPYAEPRKKGVEHKFEMNAVKVFHEYQMYVQRYIHLTPILSKSREMLNYMKDKGIIHKAPSLFEYISHYINYEAGVRDNEIIKSNKVKNRINKLTRNLADAIMVYNIKVALTQVAAFDASIAEIGVNGLLNGISNFIDENQRKFMQDESNIMIIRSPETAFMESFMEVVYTHVKFTDKPIDQFKALYNAIKKTGYKPIQIIDYFVAGSTWLGAFNNAIKTMTEEDAIKYADDIVLKTQASGASVHLATIQRDSLGRAMSLFGTFVINRYNWLKYDIVFPIAKGEHQGKTRANAFKRLLIYYIVAAGIDFLFEEILGIVSPNPTPLKTTYKKIEEGAEEHTVAMALLLEIANNYPIIGSIRYGHAPLGPVPSYIVDLGKYAHKGAGYQLYTPPFSEFLVEGAFLAAKGTGMPLTYPISTLYKGIAQEKPLQQWILGGSEREPGLLGEILEP